jgi:hypothetical protein
MSSVKETSPLLKRNPVFNGFDAGYSTALIVPNAVIFACNVAMSYRRFAFVIPDCSTEKIYLQYAITISIVSLFASYVKSCIRRVQHNDTSDRCIHGLEKVVPLITSLTGIFAAIIYYNNPKC